MVSKDLIEALHKHTKFYIKNKTIDDVIKRLCIREGQGKLSKNLTTKLQEAVSELKSEFGITVTLNYLKSRYEFLVGSKVIEPAVKRQVKTPHKPLSSLVRELENLSREELLFLQATIDLLT